MRNSFIVVVFANVLLILFGCKGSTNQEMAMETSKELKDEQLREAVDSIAEDFDARFVAMTENGIRVYVEQVIVACLMGRINAPPLPEMWESISDEFSFFAIATRPDSRAPLDRERAKEFVREMIESGLFFAPGNGFFFPSDDIKTITWVSESKAAVEFTHPAMDGVRYIFVRSDGVWLFDNIVVIDPEVKVNRGETVGQ